MTPTSRPASLRRATVLLKQLCGYLAALLLPWLGIMLCIAVPGLRGTPLALAFAAIAVVSILAGIGPGILAALTAALLFNHYILAPPAFLTFASKSAIHTCVTFCIGLLVAFLCERQRITSRRLNVTIASLQARTDSLIEAQQGSNSAAWMFSIDDRRLQWAAGGAEVFGFSFSQIADLNATHALIVDEDRARVLRAFDDAVVTEQPLQVEFRVRWPNGELHWLESRGTPSPVNPRIWHGVTIDVTDRKNAEFALVRSEKLAAIGRLSATIAHEVNNPLEAVTNLLYLAMADPQLPPATREYLHRADQELSRLSTIARRTLTFVRPRTSSGPVHAGEVVESVVAMFQPRASARGAEIRMLGNGDLLLSIPADDLRQVLTNVISNACDALPRSCGRIEVEISRHDSMAAVSVRDNGSGIAPENLQRVFDPFFTTKEDVGTGIGLWVTKDLVEKNGGRIALHTRNLPPGFHTQFRIELPVA